MIAEPKLAHIGTGVVGRIGRVPLAVWLALIVGAAAGLAQLFATSQGIGVSPDSTQYIAGARGLIAGRGYSSVTGSGQPAPIVLWPPGYPALMWLTGLFGLDPAAAARGLNLLLMAAGLMVVVGILIHHSGPSSMTVPTAVALLFASPAMISAYSWAWSEPLYLLLVFASLLLLDKHLQRPYLPQLVAAGLLAAGALLTRYVGISWIAAGALALGLWGDRQASKRLRDIGIFGLPSLVGLLAWFGRNLMVAGSPASRPLKLHRLYSVHFLPAVENLGRWIFPTADTLPMQLIGLVFLILVVGYLALRYARMSSLSSSQGNSAKLSRIPELCGLGLAAYLATLIASKFLTDPQLPLDQRLFVPGLALATIGVVCAAQSIWIARGRTLGLLAVTALGCLVLIGSVTQTVDFVDDSHAAGLGFNSVSWQQSNLVQYVDQLPRATHIYSNAYDGLNFRTGRPVYPVPDAYGVAYGQSEQDFFREVGELKQDLVGGAEIVYFDAVTWRLSASVATLRENLPLRTVFQADEGAVYAYGE